MPSLQLELDLWHDLERAQSAPVEFDFDGLLDKIERTVASSEGDRKLAIALRLLRRSPAKFVPIQLPF
ncbi:MAG: hypothetical protein AAFY57_15620 [Cyanobacteria bacterium J06642_2]